MAVRPGRCYRKKSRPYTRKSTKRPSKNYVKGAPRTVIREFEMGNKKDYQTSVYLKAKRPVQIRDIALEAGRVSCVQFLEKTLGKELPFFFKIRIYPHHILRENALATGAGADRYQQGMKAPFGSPIGLAAQVDKNQIIMEVRVDKKNLSTAKKALKKASYKLPTPCSIQVKAC